MTIDPRLLGSLRWRCVGPHRGGRVVAVAGHPTEPMTFYFGACAGGVWKTTDGGTYWENVSDGFFETAAVGALAVAPSEPNVVYAGTGEACIRGNVSHGDGVYRSDRRRPHVDERRAARHAPHRPRARASARSRHSSTWRRSATPGARTASAASSARATAARTWEHVLFRSERAGAVDLSIDPQNPRVLYAAVWEAQRTPWGMTQRRAGLVAVDVDRRRRHVDRHHAQRPACRAACSDGSASPSRRPTAGASTR